MGLAQEQAQSGGRHAVGLALDDTDRLHAEFFAIAALDQRLHRDSHADLLRTKTVAIVSPAPAPAPVPVPLVPRRPHCWPISQRVRHLAPTRAAA